MGPALLSVLLLALAALSALARGAGLKSEPEQFTVYKRHQFKYPTSDALYEFWNISAPESSPDVEECNSYNQPRPNRRRTNGSAEQRTAVLELLLVVDNALYESHLNRIASSKSKLSVKTYYEYFVGYINMVFESALPSFNLTVVPAGIVVMMRKNPQDWSERNHLEHDFIQGEETLEEFKQWLKRHLARLPRFDHAMALTQYRLGSIINGTIEEYKGLAPLGQICMVDKPLISSVSLVRDTGTLSNAIEAVHEIAHSLGVNHDGRMESVTCPNHQFLMAESRVISETASKFSCCSQRMLLRFLESPRAACLFRSEESPARRLVKTDLFPGRIYSKDFQCQKLMSAHFKEPRFCKSASNDTNSLEMSCVSLHCQNGSVPVDREPTCTKLEAAIVGTPCGNRKICLSNRCTFSPTAPCCPMEEEDNAYCSYKQQEGNNCQSKLMQLYCCKFCGHKCD